jgi:hypothetical protein
MDYRFFEVNKKGEVKETQIERRNFVTIDVPYLTFFESLELRKKYGIWRDKKGRTVSGPQNKPTNGTTTIVTDTQK